MINDQTKLKLVLNHLDLQRSPISQNNTWEKTLLEAALDYEINPFDKMVDKEKTI